MGQLLLLLCVNSPKPRSGVHSLVLWAGCCPQLTVFPIHCIVLCVILLYNFTQNTFIMHTTNLRKVGGSIMLAIPPAFLDQLDLKAGATVALAVDQSCLTVRANPRPRYTLAQLLASSDYSSPQPAQEREWVDAPDVGGEIV